MDIQYKWIVNGLGKSKQDLFEFDLPYIFEGANQIRESHPEYICVGIGLICETGDEDDQAEFGFAYIVRQDGKWVLPTHFSFSNLLKEDHEQRTLATPYIPFSNLDLYRAANLCISSVEVPVQFHKELAEAQQ